jgi:hypothetical protein
VNTSYFLKSNCEKGDMNRQITKKSVQFFVGYVAFKNRPLRKKRKIQSRYSEKMFLKDFLQRKFSPKGVI